MLLDLDSTLFGTYGSQEGEGFNFHYQAHGYHPLLCYDGLTGDLLKAELRDGTLHCSNDADKFMEPLFQEYLERGIKTYLRGDSGFSSPKLYKTSEMNDCSYAIRLKQNSSLIALASDKEENLYEVTKGNQISYAVTYGEFLYQADSWDYPRRMVSKPKTILSADANVHLYCCKHGYGTLSDHPVLLWAWQNGKFHKRGQRWI